MSLPSTRLASLLHDHDDLAAAVSMHLDSVVDSLGQKHKQDLTKAIELAETEYRCTKDLLSKMDYDGMHKQLEDVPTRMENLHPLERGREETRYLTKIYDWFVVLWQLGVEKARHRVTVRQCLMLCEDVIRSITTHQDEKGKRKSDPSLTLEIERTNGKPLETTPGGDNPSEALAWMWLELLTGSTVKYSDAEATFIKDTIAALPPTSLRVVSRLFLDRVAQLKGNEPCKTSPSSSLELSDDGVDFVRFGVGPGPFMNNQVVSLVRDCLLAPLILTFRESPTFDTYMTLVRDARYIAPSLFEVTKQKVQGNRRSRVLRMGWRSAAMVYCECGMPSDLWSLAKTLATVTLDDDVLDALLAMAGHPKADATLLGGETISALLIMVALRCTLSSCWLGIAEHYPGWDRAWDWLDDTVQDGILSAQIPHDATTKQRADRFLLLAKFGELLGPSSISAADADVPSPSVVGQKRTLDEAIGAGADDWGRARDVRKCLDVLRGCRSTGIREAVGVPDMAKYALGSNYLASIEEVFDTLHEFAPDQSVRKALVALRDVLRDQWDVPEPLPSNTPEPRITRSKRQAKARRVETAE